MAAPAYRVIIDDAAFANLADIRAYIEARGAPDTASEFVEHLLTKIHGLKTFPHGHQKRRKSRKVPHPLWQLPVDAYRVIYTIYDDQKVVRVLGVQHGGRRKWPWCVGSPGEQTTRVVSLGPIPAGGDEPFYTARAVFPEGGPLYDNAGFRGKNLIRLCDRTRETL